MKVHELLALLHKIEGFGEAEVRAFDADSGRLEPVTGIVYGTDRDGFGYFDLQTDDPE
jgi:hypothetical protein